MLVEQPFDIGLLAVLQDVIGTIGEFVGVTELLPIPTGEGRAVTVFFEPLGERDIWPQLKRRLRILGVVHEIGRDNLIFARATAPAGEMTPGTQRLERFGFGTHGVGSGEADSAAS